MPASKFTPENRAAYVALLRAGIGRRKAAANIGVAWRTVAEWRQGSSEFRDECEAAEAEATEEIEAVLFEAAKQREPWAVKEWLSKRDKERWGDKVDINVSGTVNHEAGPILERAAKLAERLEARRLELGQGESNFIDAEVVE
jgi:transposase